MPRDRRDKAGTAIMEFIVVRYSCQHNHSRYALNGYFLD